MAAPKKSKRYILFASELPIGEEARKRLARVIEARYPDLVKKRVVWLERGVIVKSDNTRVEEMKERLSLKYGGVELSSVLVSGSISKLKRAASASSEAHGQVLL